MYYNLSDTRQPLAVNIIVETNDNRRYVIDRYVGSGGFSLMYIAHLEGSSRYVALKELFPSHIENGVVERREDGKIVIYDPLTDTIASDNADAWNEVSRYLYREVELTKKASSVYDAAGRRDTQNNPDVLHVSKPFRDTKGNLYIAIDTAQGEALADLINRGFVRDDGGEILTNGNLGEILQILKNTARLLDRLHGDNQMFHLDISPDNIYLTSSGAGTELTPHIIDYGSAYDTKNPDEKTCHRFTCNPYSAPEIMALAELNDQAAGYRPDASSDTYAIVSILFYALTGRIYSTEMLFNQSWKTRIREEYPPEGYETAPEDSFASRLIRFLEQGLSASQATRFTTASALFKALSALQKAYHSSGNLLSQMDPDEVMSYAILDQYPLYDYRSEGEDLDVLCLGSGVFVRRMILSMLSCGQMIGSRLNIHVVSAEPFQKALLAQAPELGCYSNLGEGSNSEEYVNFTYEYVQDLLQPEVCAQVAKAYPHCKYVIISLGSNNKNIDLAHMYAKNISGLYTEGKAVIHYYAAEDAARNMRTEISGEGISGNVDLVPFGGEMSAYAPVIRSLSRRALRVNYLYDKLANPRIALEDTARRFVKDAYGQRSSCASALHLKYKLASIGINPSPSTNHRAIIPAYLRALEGPERGVLLELEHRRWMMYMIADGYRHPTMDQIGEYSFRDTEDGFNSSFKDTINKWHHCLVSCLPDGLRLPESHMEWDQYNSYDEIEAAGFDELDKMSLKVHLLAKKRIALSATGKKLKDDFQNGVGIHLERRATYLSELAAADPARQIESPLMDQLREQYNEMGKALSGLAESGLYTDEADQLEALEYAFKEIGIDSADGFKSVRQDLEIYIEFSRYRDYKDPDARIVDNLLWLLYADNEMTLIKLNGRTMSDNITGPLILEPKNLIYFGMESDPCILGFLRTHGNRKNIVFKPRQSAGFEAIYQELTRLRGRISGSCVIDITGGDELCVMAAMRLAQGDKAVAVIRSNENTRRIENIMGFHKAGVYQLNTSISAEEVYALYGAQQIPIDNGYMLKLNQYAMQLWDFYQKHQAKWEMLSAFFYTKGRGSVAFAVWGVQITDQTEWKKFEEREVERSKWEKAGLSDVFLKMEESGFLKELTIDDGSPYIVTVSFQYPYSDIGYDLVLSQFQTFFNKKLFVSLPLKVSIENNAEKGFNVNVSNDYQVDFTDKKAPTFEDRRTAGIIKHFPYSDIIPALNDLQNSGLITNLKYSVMLEQPLISIKYFYRDLAVKDCLMTAGNVLELYAWAAARQTGYFDDCRANLSFRWQEGVKNELDLILTKGLTTLVISCKTAKFKKEHLYEIKYLTERFSLNSKAVIVYSSTQAVDEDGHLTYDTAPVKERAKAMGVYLIDLNELDPRQLGKVFEAIAKDEYEL